MELNWESWPVVWRPPWWWRKLAGKKIYSLYSSGTQSKSTATICACGRTKCCFCINKTGKLSCMIGRQVMIFVHFCYLPPQVSSSLVAVAVNDDKICMGVLATWKVGMMQFSCWPITMTSFDGEKVVKNGSIERLASRWWRRVNGYYMAFSFLKARNKILKLV